DPRHGDGQGLGRRPPAARERQADGSRLPRPAGQEARPPEADVIQGEVTPRPLRRSLVTRYFVWSRPLRITMPTGWTCWPRVASKCSATPEGSQPPSFHIQAIWRGVWNSVNA